MKKINIKKIFLAVLTVPVFLPAFSRTDSEIKITDPYMERENSVMKVGMRFDLSSLDVKSNEVTVFTPMIVNSLDTLKLPSIGIYGRTRWYQMERAHGKPVGPVPQKFVLRYDKDVFPVEYQEDVQYKGWMNGSELIVQRSDYGCAGCNKGKETGSQLAYYREIEYEPVFYYQEAVAEAVKTRELSGRAFIDFKVNKTDILPDYRSNSTELAKITATIDSVRNDKDITVTALSIKGFASPEGPYENNVRLARGRTEALKDYVQNLYRFPKGLIKTSYEAEDWGGLKEYVENSLIENREGILAIINSDMEPDSKNTKIQKTYPVQYRFLLDNVYPGLRHSDYRIEYNIRQFSDIAEIAEIMRTSPQKLSLNEMYLLAGTLEPGSEEYNNVFETAVRMYPFDEVANLNAANAAMQRNDLIGASRYLEKAGDSAEAVYARGVLAALQGNFDIAIPLVESAISMGLQDNDGILDHMREVAKYAR